MEKVQYRPAALLRNKCQRGARVGGHRMTHALKQRQVIDGVTVKSASLKTVHGLGEGGQPVHNAFDLAFAKCSYTLESSGGAALHVARQIGRDQHVDTELACDGPRDEVIGGRDDGHQVS